MTLIKAFVVSFALFLPATLFAQGFDVAFGSLQGDSEMPVEVSADSLSVNQNDGSAVFNGNVIISQGTMRMTAPVVNVFYNPDTKGIARLVATGGVLLVQDQDAAESDEADYDLENEIIIMTGSVLLSQGANTMNSDKMTVHIAKGTANMEGRVKTIMRTGDN